MIGENCLGRIEHSIEDAIVSGASHLVKDAIPSIGHKLYDSLPSAKDVYNMLPSASDVIHGLDHMVLGDTIASSTEAVNEFISRKVYNNHKLELPSLEVLKEKAGEFFKPSDKGTDYHLSINVGGRDRDYILHTPPGYDGKQKLPLVVVLHGFMQNADRIAQQTKFSEKADKENFIVAYPNATKWFKSKHLQAWDADNGLTPLGANSDDEGFIRQMIGETKKNLNVDSNRVYAAGFSNGGMMTYKLASDLSDILAAVAVVSGGTSGKEAVPHNGVSVVHIHGTGDGTVPVAGLDPGEILGTVGVPHFEPVSRSLDDWRKNDGITDPPEIVHKDGVTGIRSINKETGQEVTAFLIDGGDHQWPGSDDAKAEDPNSPEAKFPATDIIWEFFKNHPRTDKLPNSKSETILMA